MAAAGCGEVPVIATPWGSDAGRQAAPLAAHLLPTAIAVPVPHLYNVPLALGMPVPQNAGVLPNGCVLLCPANSSEMHA
eukprot:4350272-Pleurochrysis_carterae.AAC.1